MGVKVAEDSGRSGEKRLNKGKKQFVRRSVLKVPKPIVIHSYVTPDVAANFRSFYLSVARFVATL